MNIEQIVLGIKDANGLAVYFRFDTCDGCWKEVTKEEFNTIMILGH